MRAWVSGWEWRKLSTWAIIVTQGVGIGVAAQIVPLGAWPGSPDDPAQSITFINSWSGLAWGSSLWKTVTGGATWERLHLRFDPNTQIVEAEPVSATGGWVLLAGKTNHLLFTTDAGKSWANWPLPMLNTSLALVQAAWLLHDGQTGWLKVGILGRDSNEFDAQIIFKTENAGQKWVQQWRAHLPKGTGKEHQPPRPLYFVDRVHGFAETLKGDLYTADGGVTWSEAVFHARLTKDETGDDDDAGAFFLNSRIWWQLGSKGDLWQTLDGGRNWNLLQRPGTIWPVATPGCNSSFGMHFDSSGHGILLGGDCTLHETNDGGSKWSTIKLGHPFFSLICDPTGACWVGAEDTLKLYKLVRK